MRSKIDKSKDCVAAYHSRINTDPEKQEELRFHDQQRKHAAHLKAKAKPMSVTELKLLWAKECNHKQKYLLRKKHPAEPTSGPSTPSATQTARRQVKNALSRQKRRLIVKLPTIHIPIHVPGRQPSSHR